MKVMGGETRTNRNLFQCKNSRQTSVASWMRKRRSRPCLRKFEVFMRTTSASRWTPMESKPKPSSAHTVSAATQRPTTISCYVIWRIATEHTISNAWIRRCQRHVCPRVMIRGFARSVIASCSVWRWSTWSSTQTLTLLQSCSLKLRSSSIHAPKTSCAPHRPAQRSLCCPATRRIQTLTLWRFGRFECVQRCEGVFVHAIACCRN